MVIVPRAFGVSAVLGLTVLSPAGTDLIDAVILSIVAACAAWTQISGRLPATWPALAEALSVTLLVSLDLASGLPALPYLAVPALVAGYSRGLRPLSVVMTVELLGLAWPFLMADGMALRHHLELVLPWLATAMGFGLLGAWIREIQTSSRTTSHDASYQSARRLVTQLRTVARRLSSGLDPVTMSAQILSLAHDHLRDARSALFVRTDGGVLAPMSYRGDLAQEGISPDDPVVEACWTEMEPTVRVTSSEHAIHRYRAALPLRVGSRVVGVVVSDAAAPPDQSTLQDLMPELDERSLRLDTAMVFDEVRTIATMEERQRLAREIHDGVAQEIASLGYLVDDLAADAKDPAQRRQLARLRGELSRIVSELRLSIFDLRSEVRPTSGLGAALSEYVRRVGSQSAMTVHLTLDEAPTRLRSEVETELLRIAQEAITNARKHSKADNLWVHCVVRPPAARITVRDDGQGLGDAREDSYGIRIMAERAERISAKLDISGGSGDTGTTVTVILGAEPAPAPAQETPLRADDVSGAQDSTSRR